MKKILLIDTFNFLHRAYHALPKTLTNGAGEPTNAVYGVTSMLISVFDQVRPDYVVVAMEGEGPTFRVENFTGYKAHRKPMENELSSQIPKVIEVIDAFGLTRVQVNGYEADDVIGTICERFGDDHEIVVVSNDRDLWQLLDKNVVVMVPEKGGTVSWVGEKEAEVRFGFNPDKLIDYKALRGDPSDNIPGVHGIGDKTAKKLIDAYGTVEEIYRHIGEIEPNSLKEKLANNAEEAVMSKQLATIERDIPMELDIESCKYSEFNKANVVDALKKYNFKSLIRRMGMDDKLKDSKAQEVPKDQLSLL
jgi:DNA polymerase I